MKILFLGGENHDYLNHFPEFKQHQILFGQAAQPDLFHYLAAIENHSFDVVLVTHDLLEQATPRSFANWLRIVKPNGQLLLQTQENHTWQQHLWVLEPLISHLELYHNHTTRLIKKNYTVPFQHYIRAALLSEAHSDLNHAHYYYALANAAYPNVFEVAQYTALFYDRLNLPQQTDAIWQQMQHQQPHNAAVAWARTLSVLASGDYVRGFRMREHYANQYMPFERRSHAYPPPPPQWHHRRWQGECLKHKTFVVWSEFGLGDEIMFASLAKLFKSRFQVKQLIWVVQPAIYSLMQSHPDIDVVLNAENAAEHLTMDYWDFPHALLAHVDEAFTELPKRFPYLSADAHKQRFFAQHMQTHKKHKIGLVWRGDPKHENDAYRSIHQVDLLNVLLDIPDVAWFNVQKALNDTEKQWLSAHHIHDLSTELHDFADTAAALTQLDLLLAVDTSVVHVAGALNIPALVMLPSVYDWRWGMPQSGNSIWYPSVQTLFPPNPLNNWADTLMCVREKVMAYFSKTPS